MKERNIIVTVEEDWSTIWRLFRQAMSLQGRNGYRVWDRVDEASLKKDIAIGMQFKIIDENVISCLFSVQLSDPLIWRDRDRGDALYLHRIVVNPACKGQRQFSKVLDWARHYAYDHGLDFIRMDTWADNAQLIDYYRTYGFVHLEDYTTPDDPRLPLQNRSLRVALLELKL